MDEKNREPKPEKKISRTTLTFYIIGMFSVAIALILISYVAQARADRQLENLHTKLSEQQTVAQGATQKMEEIQKQMDAQRQTLDSVSSELGGGAEQDIAAAAKRRMEEREVYAALARTGIQLLAENRQEAQAEFDRLTAAYGEARLLGNAKENSFDSEINLLYEAVKQALSEQPEDDAPDTVQ